MLTLVEEDVQVPQLRQAETLDEVRIFILKLLAHRGQLFLGELPVFPLGRLPVIGRHLPQRVGKKYELTASQPQQPAGGVDQVRRLWVVRP